ncbi:hypothetical protein EW146_g9492 [Bondarzewia mesenterica]|uniref:Uncharacterized protein n=1 Tax=Bondarzewia mesenterica TaxID=1095465 RepID=A0A4S4L615_9AGAM|nr:hypothetical protein EW146_g9492 [Bondarzewia mesenterica]
MTTLTTLLAGFYSSMMPKQSTSHRLFIQLANESPEIEGHVGVYDHPRTDIFDWNKTKQAIVHSLPSMFSQDVAAWMALRIHRSAYGTMDYEWNSVLPAYQVQMLEADMNEPFDITLILRPNYVLTKGGEPVPSVISINTTPPQSPSLAPVAVTAILHTTD